MSAFQSIKQGLTEAVAHAKGKQAGVNEYQPYEVDVAGLRKRLGLTQEQFAARFGFSVATLRHPAPLGTRRPDAPRPRPGIVELDRPGTQGGDAGFGCVSVWWRGCFVQDLITSLPMRW